MTGSETRTYILKEFIRTDKDTELYQATTDAVMTMARKFNFTELETDSAQSDTISVLGDYKISLDSNMGYLVADIVVRDGDSSYPLEMISKDQFNRLYPNPDSSTVLKAKPRHACVYASQIYLGPVPDSTAYTYRTNFTTKLTAEVESGTANVPFSGLNSRECLREYALEKLYGVMQEHDLSALHRNKAEIIIKELIMADKKVKRPVVMTRYQGV